MAGLLFRGSERSPPYGMVGPNPFGTALDEAARDETVRGHKLVIQYVTQFSELRECHLLFVGELEKERMEGIMAELGSAAVLTVSELPDFARRAGVTHLYNDGRKVRFEINLQAAQGRGLKLNAQLLGLAKIVPPAEGK